VTNVEPRVETSMLKVLLSHFYFPLLSIHTLISHAEDFLIYCNLNLSAICMGQPLINLIKYRRLESPYGITDKGNGDAWLLVGWELG